MEGQERVVKVGVEGESVYPMLVIWKRIDSNEESYYTFEVDKKATVIAQERNGTKYLTTHPDGITDNNLDELKECGV